MKSIDEDQIIKDVLRTNGIFSDQVLFYIQINIKYLFIIRIQLILTLSIR